MRIAGAAVALVAVVFGLSVEAESFAKRGSATRTVRVKDIDFHPHVITIQRGTTVRWSFLDAATPHTVTSRGTQRFRSSPTKTKGAYTVRFTRPGTYRYACTIHFNMQGKVIVR